MAVRVVFLNGELIYPGNSFGVSQGGGNGNAGARAALLSLDFQSHDSAVFAGFRRIGGKPELHRHS